MQLLRRRSDMQHARPNDGAGRGEGHAAFRYASKTQRATQELIQELHRKTRTVGSSSKSGLGVSKVETRFERPESRYGARTMAFYPGREGLF